VYALLFFALAAPVPGRLLGDFVRKGCWAC
jgi:hypothetical protein